MKLLMKLALAVFALTLTISAFAVQKDVTLASDTTLNGQKLAAGDYTLVYQIHGDTADVKLVRDKKTVATATGQVVAHTNSPDYTAFVKSNNSDGTSMIVEIQPAKEKSAIRFTPQNADTGN